MTEYHECESRGACDDARADLTKARAEIKRLRAVIQKLTNPELTWGNRVYLARDALADEQSKD